MNHELPAGWEAVPLRELIEPRMERVSPQSMPDAPFIGMEHVEPHTNQILETVPASKMASNAARFHAGDVLYGRMRPYLNKVALPSFDGLSSAEFIVFPKNDVLDSRFLLRLLSSSDFTEFACSQYEGDRPRVKFEQLGNFKILLPPAAEQARIVEKLEELLSDLDAGIAELKAAQRKLAQYRSSLLKAAMEGTLTAEWRTTRRPIQETGSDLLQRILTERRTRWEQKQLAKLAEQKRTPPKGWQAKYPKPVAPDLTGLPALPKGWAWATLDQCAIDEDAITDGPFGSNLKSEHYTDSGPRVIRLQNIGDGRFLDARAHVSEERYERLRKHAVVEGDIAIAMLGEVLPRACVVPAEVGPAIVKADCARVRLNPELIPPLLAVAALNAEPTRMRVSRLTKGIGRTRVNLGHIRSIAIPLPPSAEQDRILVVLSEFLQSCDTQNLLIERELSLSAAQRKNILKTAFTGQLVPQDPDDEPASKLLEHLRQERAAQPRAKRSRQMNKSSSGTRNAVDQIRTWIDSRDSFTFEELRRAVPAPYQALKDSLFTLLAETPPFIEQEFARKPGLIRFRRIKG